MINYHWINRPIKLTQMQKLKEDAHPINSASATQCTEIAKDILNLHHSTTATNEDILQGYTKLVECQNQKEYK